MGLVREAPADEAGREKTDDRQGMIELRQLGLEAQPRLVDAIAGTRKVDDLRAQAPPQDRGKRLLPAQPDSGDRRLAGEDERGQRRIERSARSPAPLRIGAEMDLTTGSDVDPIEVRAERRPVSGIPFDQ